MTLTTLLATLGLLGAPSMDLAGTWQLTGLDQHKKQISCPISVPGGVHTALLKAGKMKDVFYGRNEMETIWVARRPWTISRTFEVGAELLAKKEIVLRLEDCDTFCTVFVNGHEVGKTTNRFRRWDFDVKPYLKEGTNELRGVFESAVKVADLRFYDYGRFFPMSNVPWSKNQALIRKPACHGGWDWGPELEVTGFCGTVALFASDGPRVDYVHCNPRFNDDLSHCSLEVVVDFSDGVTERKTIEIDNPPLWWPNGAGTRQFYTLDTVVRGHRIVKRLGLRKLEVLNEKTVSAEGKDELSMTFRVNNRRLFMKGANWIPCDAYENRQTPEKYRDLLESAAKANMNMIRVWGGGQYEKDVFYDICDELGILLWHDMMCSCAVYPGDEAFLGEIRAELSHQLRRLKDHASIAMWCGDNECLGAIRWFLPIRFDLDLYKSEWILRSKLQGECVAKFDPLRTYWPSSPCCGPNDFGDGWKEDSKGDMHNWTVWHENAPFDEYYKFRPRFCSEFGYQSFPSFEVALTFASKEQIADSDPEMKWDFEWHQKNAGGNRRIRETMQRYFRPVKDSVSELLLSQFQQGMAIKMAVDGWRAQRPRCMGTLFWQLNDNWPVASWSSIEYGGKWKPLQYLAKRFNAPISVVAGPDGSVTAMNDTANDVQGVLTLETIDFTGKILRSERKNLEIPADAVVKAATYEKTKDAFLLMTLKTDAGTCVNDWQFAFFKDNAVAHAKLDVKVDGFKVTIATDRPAFYVWANATGIRGEFDDNCLTLVPGRPVTLTFTPKEKVSPAAFEKALSVTHLMDLCR